MGQKRGSGGGGGRAGGGLSAGGMRGGGGGSAADTQGQVSSGLGTAVPVLGAWLRYGKYVVAPIARLVYGSTRKYKIGGQQVGRAAYNRYQAARRANAVQAAATGGQYVPPTEAEWKRRAAAVNAPRPRQVPPKVPPKAPPPPPPPRGPVGPRKIPGMGGPGSIRGQIFAYVVANGVVWAITKFGEWIREREATAEEIRTGQVAGRTAGGGPRRGRAVPQPSRSEPLSPIQIFQKRLPVPSVRPVLRPSPPPIAKQPTLAPSPQLERIIVTAQRLPVPVPAKPVPTWLKILKAVPAGTNPLALLQGKKTPKAAKQLGRALTALQERGVTSSLQQSSISSFSSFGGQPGRIGSKTCECKPKRKKKPKVPREICYTGTYTERADGLTKLKRRKVPCRSSAKSPASRRTAA